MWVNFAFSLWFGLNISATCMALPTVQGYSEFVCYVEANNQRYGVAGRFAPLGKDETMPGPSPKFDGIKPPDTGKES